MSGDVKLKVKRESFKLLSTVTEERQQLNVSSNKSFNKSLNVSLRAHQGDQSKVCTHVFTIVSL